MKKFYKHLGIVFVMAFAILIGCFSNNVFAADDGVIGTSNLNGTAQNSAKVGDQLKAPEIGWKREHFTKFKAIYTGTWIDHPSPAYDGGLSHETNIAGNSVKFKFYGTKFRLINYRQSDIYRCSNVLVNIDGVDIESYSLVGDGLTSCVVYEKTGLELKEHTITLTKNDNRSGDGVSSWYQLVFESVDIDDTGYFIDPSAILATGISLDKTSLTMKKDETSPLTAAIVPDNATNKNVIWKSSDDSIAKVDQTGKVTAVKEGTATITATTQDGSNLSATCVVTVTPQGTTPTNPTDNTGNAILTLTMTNGNIKSYTVSMSKVNDFISWYNNRSAGSNGSPYYAFDKTDSSQPFLKKTEYVVFDKISSFEVDEYTKQ